MAGCNVFIPLATPWKPVGFARLGVGLANAPALPVANFDIETVGAAWAELHHGELWPAVGPRASLRWQPVFQGSAEEISAGRSRGKSAQLGILLAVAAWKNIAGQQNDESALRVWATGELDNYGRIHPVDDLAHKLSVYCEHAILHRGRSIFVAPAANRAGMNLEPFERDRGLRELHFTPEQPPRFPSDERPTILWVNRNDTKALCDWLASSCRDDSAAGRRRNRLLATFLLGLLVVLAAWWLLARPARLEWWRRPEGIAPVLATAPFVTSIDHRWSYQPEGLARQLGAHRDGDTVWWEEPVESLEHSERNECGPTRQFPEGMKLRYALGPGRLQAGIIATLPAALAALLDLGYNSRAGLAYRVLLDSGFFKWNRYHGLRLFDPRLTVLGGRLADQGNRLLAEGLVSGFPASMAVLVDSNFRLHSSLAQTTWKLVAANTCRTERDNGPDQHRLNRFCPVSEPATAGRAVRRFHLAYNNPRHSYTLGFLSSDNGNTGWVKTDGRDSLRCRGPYYATNFSSNTYPGTVELGSDRSWSHVNVFFELVALADGVSAHSLSLDAGSSRSQPAFLTMIAPGWHASPRPLAYFHFDSAEQHRLADRGIGNVHVRDGRLYLVRRGGEYGRLTITLDQALPASFQTGYTAGLVSNQSLVALCLANGKLGREICLTMNNMTENGSQAGYHLFCDSRVGKFGAGLDKRLAHMGAIPEQEIAHRLRVEIDGGQPRRFIVDEIYRFEVKRSCLLTGIDTLILLGYQESNPGHGGWVDDIVLATTP